MDKNPFSLGEKDKNPDFLNNITTPGSGNQMGANHPGFGPQVNDPYANNKLPKPPTGSRSDPFGPPGHSFVPDYDHFKPPQ